MRRSGPGIKITRKSCVSDDFLFYFAQLHFT